MDLKDKSELLEENLASVGSLLVAYSGGTDSAYLAYAAHRALGERIRAGIPVGRVATPREIAGPVLFLCTPLAGFISGEVVNVNGGAVLIG